MANENDLLYEGNWNIFLTDSPPPTGYYMVTKEGTPRTTFPAFYDASRKEWRLYKNDPYGSNPIPGIIAWTLYPEPLEG